MEEEQMRDSLTIAAELQGITREELVTRLATWTDEDWAAEDARIEAGR
jgi:hypothetical protein